MMLFAPRRRTFGSGQSRSAQFIHCIFVAAATCLTAACGKDTTGPSDPVEVASISIDTPSVQLERGTHKVFTATAKDSKGKIVIVPFVWRSSDDNVATL